MSNSDKAVPEIEFSLGGQKYQLVFSLKTFCLVEQSTGKNFIDGNSLSKIDLSTLTTILWAAMQTHHPEITLDDLRGRLTMNHLGELYAVMAEGFNKAASKAEGVSEKKIDVPLSPPIG